MEQMRLPRAVRRKYQRALEIERSMKEGGQEQQEQEQQPAQEQAGGEVHADATVSEQQQDVQSQGVVQQPQQQQSDPRENDVAYWKQRFSSTQGILRREREERIAMERKHAEEIAALRAELAKLKEAASQKTLDLSAYLTAEQVEQLGEDKAAEMVALAKKVAEDEVRRRVEAELGPIREAQQRESRARQRELANKFHDDLSEAVPNWQEINAMEDWLDFLGQEDERTGLVRQDIIDMAQARYDARPIIALLREFMRVKGMVRDGAPAVTPQSTAAAGRANASVEPEEPKRILTPQEIKRRYTEIAMNKRLSDKDRMKQLAELDEMYKYWQRRGTAAM